MLTANPHLQAYLCQPFLKSTPHSQFPTTTKGLTSVSRGQVLPHPLAHQHCSWRHQGPITLNPDSANLSFHCIINILIHILPVPEATELSIFLASVTSALLSGKKNKSCPHSLYYLLLKGSNVLALIFTVPGTKVQMESVFPA